MALYIFTGDGVVHYRIVDLYWGRPVEYGAVDPYWGRCGRVWRCMSQLETVW